jgi:hypothetical protein
VVALVGVVLLHQIQVVQVVQVEAVEAVAVLVVLYLRQEFSQHNQEILEHLVLVTMVVQL